MSACAWYSASVRVKTEWCRLLSVTGKCLGQVAQSRAIFNAGIMAAQSLVWMQAAPRLRCCPSHSKCNKTLRCTAGCVSGTHRPSLGRHAVGAPSLHAADARKWPMAHLRELFNRSARRRQTLATANAVPNARQGLNAKRMLGVLRRPTTCQPLLNSSPASSVQGQRPQKLVLIPAATRGLTHKATATNGCQQAQAAASYFSRMCKCRGGAYVLSVLLYTRLASAAATRPLPSTVCRPISSACSDRARARSVALASQAVTLAACSLSKSSRARVMSSDARCA